MVLLGCLAAAAVSGSALDRVTVDQLEQRVAADHSRGGKDLAHRDQDLAHRLQKLELTQRLSTARLKKLEASLPGPESRNALMAVADVSVVLDPPANEILTDAAPTKAEQQQMLERAPEASAPSSVDRMPEFDATMKLTRFRNLKYMTSDHSEPVPLLLPVPRALDSDSDAVTHREGRLIVTHTSQSWVPNESLKTGVENWDGLYTVMANVLQDMRGAQPDWVGWEQGPTGKVAVFRFAVDQNHAHFPLRSVMDPTPKLGFDGHPGYRAEVALDPATGAVQRFVLHAAIAPGQHLLRADVVVEFAPAAVDGKSFLCPQRAITIGVSQSLLVGWNVNLVAFGATGSFDSHLSEDIRPLTDLTDVEFVDYRLGQSKPPIVVNPAFLEAAIQARGERVHAEQLEKTVADLHGLDDREAAERLEKLDLTQRLTAERCKRMRDQLPGKASVDALLAICDEAEFGELPAADLAEGAAPDALTQGKIVLDAVDFVARVTHKMPDLLATRQLSQFEDLQVVHGAPQPIEGKVTPERRIANSADPVHFREGREVVEARPKFTYGKAQASGLDTWGTFGPILEIVMADALKAKIGWGHWEKGPVGRLAVFRYAVPEADSHFNVRFCCYLAEDGLPSSYATTPGYHGELAIDPETGAVLRLVLKADVRQDGATPVEKEKSPLLRSDVLVEYGAVDIAGKQYIVPQRAVSVMTSWTLGGQGPLKKPMSRAEGKKAALKALELMEFSRVNAINEAVFRNYHVFETEVKLVADPADAGAETPKK
jgi:hypothetical protein